MWKLHMKAKMDQEDMTSWVICVCEKANNKCI